MVYTMCVNCGTYYRIQPMVCAAPLTDGRSCPSREFELVSDVPMSHLLPRAYAGGHG